MKTAMLTTVALGIAATAHAQDEHASTLSMKAHSCDRIIDGRIENANVPVEGNLIAVVSADPIEAVGL